ncbi:MAG: S8 family peptidase [Bacteriovorax sp.]
MKNHKTHLCVKRLLLVSTLFSTIGFSWANEEKAIGDKSWFINKINAPLFWEKSKGSKSVKVLVCDTGIESNHPGLRGNISLPGRNFVDGSTNTEPTGNAHGTRVAGLIGGKDAANGDMIGVNWDVQIVPGKISNLPSGQAVHTDTAKCVKWGADQGIRIVNLSFSGALDNPDVMDAAKYLYDHGGLLIISAGNDGQLKDFPDNPYMIAVGATNDIDWVMPWSGKGDYVDISAPGSNMYTTDVGGKYLLDRGASMSTAVVSGAAALILSVRPDFTAEQLKQALLNSTIDLGKPGRDQSWGVGRLDLGKAVEVLGL